MASSLKEKTARGLLWGAIDNGGMQLIGLIFGIILGRLLTPGDYGMIAMITINLISVLLSGSFRVLLRRSTHKTNIRII